MSARPFWYECGVCHSRKRLFAQCQPCLMRFIKVTDVAEKSKHPVSPTINPSIKNQPERVAT